MRSSGSGLLLVGATGFIGRALLPALAARHPVTAARFNSPEPADTGVEWIRVAPEELPAVLRALRPAAIVNAAALATPSACRADPGLARRLNVELPTLLAESDARLIHLSTDQVFDGRRGRYTEADEAAPISVYGQSKLEGEARVLDRSPGATVLRVNLVCGRSAGPRPSSVDSMLAAAERGEEIRLFTDEYRSPVGVDDVVRAIAALVECPFRGILHLGGPRLSRWDLGHPILERHRLADRAREASIRDYDGPPRAPDTSFDSTRAQEVLGFTPHGLVGLLAQCS